MMTLKMVKMSLFIPFLQQVCFFSSVLKDQGNLVIAIMSIVWYLNRASEWKNS